MSGYNQTSMALEKKLHNLMKEYAANEQQMQSAFNVMADQLVEAKKRIAYLEESLSASEKFTIDRIAKEISNLDWGNFLPDDVREDISDFVRNRTA